MLVASYDLIMPKKVIPGVCEEVFCKCGATTDDGSEMLPCDNCNRWSHCACYNLSEVEAADDDLRFLCQVCNPSVSANLSTSNTVLAR